MTIEMVLRQKGTHIATIDPEVSIKTAADRLCVRINGALVVTSGKAVLGLISEREIVQGFSSYGEAAASMPVREIMRSPVLTTFPDESVDRVIQLMTRNRMRHMPVLRNGKLAGIVRIDDLLKHRLEALERETRVLRDAYFEEANRVGRGEMR
jgi:CBS domain-containing protein